MQKGKFMKIIFFFLITTLATACTPHKFDAFYKKNSNSYNRKLEHVEKINQKKAKDHAIKKREIELTNSRLQRRNKIPNRIQIEAENDYTNRFTIRNNMNEDLFVEFERSSMIKGNKSYRVVSGKTRRKDTNLSVPDQIIAAGTMGSVSFFSDEGSDSLNYLYYDKLNISIRVGNQRYKIEKYRELSARSPNLVKRPDRYLGRVSYLSTLEEQLCGWTMIFYGGYCWAIGDADDSDFEEARKIASYEFGVPVNEIELKEIEESYLFPKPPND
jgi:hypothetical protein